MVFALMLTIPNFTTSSRSPLNMHHVRIFRYMGRLAFSRLWVLSKVVTSSRKCLAHPDSICQVMKTPRTMEEPVPVRIVTGM